MITPGPVAAARPAGRAAMRASLPITAAVSLSGATGKVLRLRRVRRFQESPRGWWLRRPQRRLQHHELQRKAMLPGEHEPGFPQQAPVVSGGPLTTADVAKHVNIPRGGQGRWVAL